MKRFAILALVFALVLSWAAGASASELKAKGTMQAEGVWMDNWDFRSMEHGGVSEDDFQVYERARIQFEFIANENLKGVVQLQIGTGAWGNGGFTLGQGDGGVGRSTSLRTRRAYLQFNWPDTSVSVTGGYFALALPSAATGSAILDEEVAALAISTPIIEDRLSALLVYGRGIDINLEGGINDGGDGFTEKNDEYDVFALALPITFDGISFTPFGVYGYAGKDALNLQAAGYNNGGYNLLRGLTPAYITGDIAAALDAAGIDAYTEGASTWWAGFSYEMTMFDPFWVALDFNYGAVDTELLDDSDLGDRSGWYVDFAVAYNGLDMVKPKLFFAYGSGDDDDVDNGSERMPFLSHTSHGYGSFYYGYGSSFAMGDMSSGTGNDLGQWVLGLGLEQITFLDKLSHDFYFMYIQGTNDHEYVENNAGISAAIQDNGLWGFYLTDKDYLFELDLNTKYQIYEELTAVLELGAIFANFDDDVWGIDGNGDNAYKVALGLVYSF